LGKNHEPHETERRRYPRLNVPVLFRSAKKGEEASPTYNLGLGGVRIYSNRYLKKGEKLQIELCFPERNSVVADVQVVWIKVLPPNSDAVFDVGLEFIDLPSETIEKIEDMLKAD
jgi:hypothetical protein